MNTITNITVRNLSIALAALLLVAVSFAIAPKAQASEFFDTEWFDTGYQDTWAPSYDGTSYDTGWIDTGYQDTWSPSYDTGYGSYMPSYGGYGGGSYYSGGGFMGGSGYSAPGYTNVNTNVNENYCTNGSCNTSSSVNAPTTIVTNYAPAQTYQQPPVYTPPVYYPTQQPYYQQPIAYNRPAPYVSLAAVPYTGLDLGPWGTALYWGFLVLWCLIAAYLIAVKKIQNKIAAWFVGTEPKILEQKSGLPASGVLAETGDPRTFEREFLVKSAPAKPQFAGIDPFIQSQINRAK